MVKQGTFLGKQFYMIWSPGKKKKKKRKKKKKQKHFTIGKEDIGNILYKPLPQ